MIDRDTALDLVHRGARIRVHAGAIGLENHVMAEGTVVGYGDGPMLGVEHDDGRLTWWLTRLPIVEVDKPDAPVRPGTRHAYSRAELSLAVKAAYEFADELDNSGKQPTLLAMRLRERLDQALTVTTRSLSGGETR